MICVECGKETSELHEGVCKECFLKKHVDVELENPIEIQICSTCGSVRREGKWIEKPDLNTILLERVDDSLSISSGVDKYSLELEFQEEDPTHLHVFATVKLHSDGFVAEKNLSTRVILQKEECENCSLQRSDYYEAILQVRPPEGEISPEDKASIIDIVHQDIDVDRGEERKVFITAEKEIHGGLDFFISNKQAARKISNKIKNRFGGELTTSSELVGREDGQNVYRMTYSVRLPRYGKNDYIEYQGDIYQIKKINQKAGYIELRDVQSREKKSLDDKEMEDVDILGGEELTQEAVKVSESEGEIQVLDPDNYKTKTLKKPKHLDLDKDSVKVIKVKGKLHAISSKKKTE